MLSDRQLANFVRKIRRDGECWMWTAATLPSGYGIFDADRTRLAHRVSYETFVGAIPTGLGLDHICRNRACINPDHLEPVTAGVNSRRSPLVTARKSHCKRGHEFDATNTHIRKNGTQYCRACARAYQKARRT